MGWNDATFATYASERSRWRAYPFRGEIGDVAPTTGIDFDYGEQSKCRQGGREARVWNLLLPPAGESKHWRRAVGVSFCLAKKSDTLRAPFGDTKQTRCVALGILAAHYDYAFSLLTMIGTAYRRQSRS